METKYRKLDRKEIRTGLRCEFRQHYQKYIYDDNKKIIKVEKWDGNINESNENNYWIEFIFGNEDILDPKINFGHNDIVPLFSMPVRIKSNLYDDEI